MLTLAELSLGVGSNVLAPTVAVLVIVVPAPPVTFTAGQSLPVQKKKKALTDLLPVLLPLVSVTVTVFVRGRLFAPCPANP